MSGHEWLEAALIEAARRLDEDAEGYCLGRGLPEPLLRDCRVGLWRSLPEPCPDDTFASRFGPHGRSLDGWLTFPVWAPSGKLLGAEFRRWDGEKQVVKHYLPASKWTPVFFGMCYPALVRIASGADVWLVEGVFDMAVGHVVDGVVLTCGGAKVSHAHARFLSRFMRPSAVVYLCFDEDPTGRGMAAGRHDNAGKWHAGGKQILEGVGLRVQDVRYRGGKDPGVIWDHGGRDALRSAFRSYLRN